MPPAVLSALREDHITLTHAHWLTRLADSPETLDASLKRAVNENLSSRDLETLVANLTSDDGEGTKYDYFSPRVVTTKAGSRLRFEPRRNSVRVELNISHTETVEVILAELKRQLKKVKRTGLQVVR